MLSCNIAEPQCYFETPIALSYESCGEDLCEWRLCFSPDLCDVFLCVEMLLFCGVSYNKHFLHHLFLSVSERSD